MREEYISIAKGINMLSVGILVASASPLFFYGKAYNEYIVLLGVILYGISLRVIGSHIDYLVRVK
jgi:hypothetical protein